MNRVEDRELTFTFLHRINQGEISWQRYSIVSHATSVHHFVKITTFTFIKSITLNKTLCMRSLLSGFKVLSFLFLLTVSFASMAQDVVFQGADVYSENTCTSSPKIIGRFKGYVYGYAPGDGPVTFYLKVGGLETSEQRSPNLQNGQYVFDFTMSQDVTPGMKVCKLRGVIKGVNTSTGDFDEGVGPNYCYQFKGNIYIDKNKNCLFDSLTEPRVPGPQWPLDVNGVQTAFTPKFDVTLGHGTTVTAKDYSIQYTSFIRNFKAGCRYTTSIYQPDTAWNFAYTYTDSSGFDVDYLNVSASVAPGCEVPRPVVVNVVGTVYGRFGSGATRFVVKIESETQNVGTVNWYKGGGFRFEYNATFNNLSAGMHYGVAYGYCDSLPVDTQHFSVNVTAGNCEYITGALYRDKNGNCEFNEGVDEKLEVDSLPFYVNGKMVWSKGNYQIQVAQGQDGYVYSVPFTVQKTASTFRKYKPVCSNSVNTSGGAVVNLAYTYKDSVDANLGIHSLDGGPKFSFHPNPANQELTIDLEQENEVTAIQITDLCGKVQWIVTEPEKQSKVNLDRFTAGVYMVTVQTSDSRTTRKLVIQK